MRRYKLKELSLKKLEYGANVAATNYDGYTRYIRITDIDEKGELGKEVVSPSASEEKYILNEGDILFARTGATVGKTYRYRKEDGRCLYAGFLIRVVPNEALIRPDYLYFFTKSSQYKKFVQNNMKVVAQPNINARQYGDLEINVPDLIEQDEVIKKILTLNKISEMRRKQLNQLDKLIKARFIELFGDLKSNSKGWPIVGFNECAEIDTNMIHDFEGYEDYPHIGIDSIEKETGRLSGYRTVAEDGVISGKYLFTEKHIIYSKIRPNLNKVAMPDFVGVCSADAYPILVKDDICVKEYLGYTMRSKYFLDYIVAFSNRTNLPKVNKKQVEGFALPLPPMELQQQFAAFVSQVDKSKVAVQKALDETQLLFDSLMQEYFG